MDAELEQIIDGIGPRLRTLRRDRGLTLEALAATTGMSVSTLSRLESGKRRPTLELLIPLARTHRVALDQLVAAPPPVTLGCISSPCAKATAAFLCP